MIEGSRIRSESGEEDDTLGAPATSSAPVSVHGEQLSRVHKRSMCLNLCNLGEYSNTKFLNEVNN